MRHARLLRVAHSRSALDWYSVDLSALKRTPIKNPNQILRNIVAIGYCPTPAPVALARAHRIALARRLAVLGAGVRRLASSGNCHPPFREEHATLKLGLSA